MRCCINKTLSISSDPFELLFFADPLDITISIQSAFPEYLV